MNVGHLDATDVKVTAVDTSFISFLGTSTWSVIEAGYGESFTVLYDVIPGRPRDPGIVVSWKAGGTVQRPFRQPLPLER